MPKLFLPSFPLLIIPNSLNNFQKVRESDLPSSIFDWYVFFFALFIRSVTLFRISLYAVMLKFISLVFYELSISLSKGSDTYLYNHTGDIIHAFVHGVGFAASVRVGDVA